MASQHQDATQLGTRLQDVDEPAGPTPGRPPAHQRIQRCKSEKTFRPVDSERRRRVSAAWGTLCRVESFQLFAVDPADPPRKPERSETHEARRPMPEESLHQSERFLAAQLEREGDLAALQVALSLHEASERLPGGLSGLSIDEQYFPRTAWALRHARVLAERPVSERPEGFWPRFLLAQLEQADAF